MENFTFSSDDFNDTLPEMYRRKFSMRILGSSFTALIGIISVLGNLAVILASFCDKTLRNQASNLFLVYLSITDAITGLFTTIPLAVSVARDYWPFGDALCKIHNGLYYACTASSSFNILIISIDRAIAVMKPLQYPNVMSTKRVVSLCIFLFCLGAFVMMAVMIFDWSRYNYSDGSCIFDLDIYAARFMTLPTLFFCFHLPALGVVICNSLIVFAALKQKKRRLFTRRGNVIAPQNNSNHSNLNKTILSMVAVAATYYITQLPFVSVKTIEVLLDRGVSGQLHYFFVILMHLSPAVNPFIYGILRKDYRNAYKKVLRIIIQKITRQSKNI